MRAFRSPLSSENGTAAWRVIERLQALEQPCSTIKLRRRVVPLHPGTPTQVVLIASHRTE
jgi:hypothetical protein